MISSKGLDVAMDDFEGHFAEHGAWTVEAIRAGRFRVNLNLEKLSLAGLGAMEKSGLQFPNNIPFVSIVARSLEMVHAFEVSLLLIDACKEPVPSRQAVSPCAGLGGHVTEAPRGMLYHRYELDEQGMIKEARLIPPTSQNLRRMEDDLRAYVPGVIDLPLEEATWLCEQLIRNYDPCISCATHFLKLSIKQA